MAALRLTAADLPERRPPGLRLTTRDLELWRIDKSPPDTWSWTAFPQPQGRFDPSNARVRYAALTERGAFREHFHDSKRRIREHHRELTVVRLQGRLSVLDLRDERTLDLLSIDDEINVGRDDRVLDACRLLMTRAVTWWGDRLHGVVYRSRTTPATSANVAFTAAAPLTVASAEPLAARRETLAELLVDDGFRLVGWDL